MVREMLIQNYEYLQDYWVRMAHHSTAIEGNTLTQDQTANILLKWNYLKTIHFRARVF